MAQNDIEVKETEALLEGTGETREVIALIFGNYESCELLLRVLERSAFSADQYREALVTSSAISQLKDLLAKKV